MSDPAAPALQVCLPAAQSPARIPPGFGAELPLHTRGASALPADEVTGAGDCPGASSQAAGKLAPTPSPVWDGSGHGEEQLQGTLQRYPGGLWEMGKEQVNVLLC